MTHRILGAWAEFLTTLAIWAAYFIHLGQAVVSGRLEDGGFARIMGLHFAVSVLVAAIAGVIISSLVEVAHRRSGRRRSSDEAWAGLRATRLAHGVVVVLIMILSALALILGAFAGPALASEVNGWLGRSVANGLVLSAHAGLLVLVLAELVHYGALATFLSGVRR